MNEPQMIDHSDRGLSFVVENDTKQRPIPPHLKERLNKGKNTETNQKTIQEKLAIAEQNRKVQQEQRLARMKQREADCRRASEYLGMIPPQKWGKQVLAQSLQPLQKDYEDIMD